MFGIKETLFSSEETILDKIVNDIEKETDPGKLTDLVKRFKKRQSEKLVEFRRKPQPKLDQKSSDDLPKYFWIPTKTGKTYANQDLALVKYLVHNMKSAGEKEKLPGNSQYQFLENKYLKRLEKERKFRILNALKFVIQVDKDLSINQKHHTRNTIRDNPLILDFLEERLGTIGNIPESEHLSLIMAFIDLIVEIFELPKGENWVWLIQVLVMDIIQMCEELDKLGINQTECKRIVILLNMMYSVFILLFSMKDLDIALKMIQLSTKTLLVNKDWEVPSHYAELLKTCGIKSMNMLEIACTKYYKSVIRINYCIENDLDATIFEDEILRLYKLAITKMKENEPEDSVLFLYELVALCHQMDDKFFLCVAYTHLSYSFFTLRKTKTANVYLELLIQMAREYNMTLFEMLAHKQIGLIAACESKLDISIYHFKMALEIGENNANIKSQLFDGMDDIRICIGEVIARHKLTQGLRVSLDEPYDVNPICTCTMYTKEI